jgi:hypothetical protein
MSHVAPRRWRTKYPLSRMQESRRLWRSVGKLSELTFDNNASCGELADTCALPGFD